MSESPERWRRIQALFGEAVARSADEREAFLLAEAGDDPSLLAEIRRLLSADEGASGFLEDVIQAEVELTDVSEGPDLEIPARIGKYSVQGILGEGGFGVVYSGRDPDLERDVAIKTCTSRNADFRRRFFREARIAARLSHPRITTVHDFGQEGKIPFLVQELLDGHDLQETIDRRDPVEPAVRIRWLLQVAEGLRHAHDQGVLHRDVKPGNVRILSDGRIKIMDFGIAKLLHEASGLTETGVAIGTIGYLAPEQLRDTPVGAAADLFAFGVLAYELLTYRRPFVGSTFSAVSWSLLNRDPESVESLWPDCPEALASLVHRCLAKDPEGRPESFREVEESLREVLRRLDPELPWPDLPSDSPSPQSTVRMRSSTPETSGSDLEPTVRLEPRKRAGPSRRTVTRILVAIGVGAVVGGGLWLGGHSNSPPPVVADQPASSSGEAAEPAAPSEDPTAPERDASADDPSPLADSPAIKETAPTTSNAGLDDAPTASAGPRGSEQPRTERRVAEAAPAAGPAGSDPATPPATDSRPDSDPEDPPPEQIRRDPTELTSDPRATAAAALGEPVPDPARQAPETTPSTEDPSAGEKESFVPMRLGDWIDSEAAGVTAPVLLSHPDPEYPARARRRGEEARVRLGLAVDEAGSVAQVVTLESSGSNLGFDEAARAVAQRARYRPGTRDGIPGKMWTELVIEFERPDR